VIGGVETGTFEDNPYWLEYFMKCFLVALRAAFERRFAEGLLSFEMNPAGFAPISIDGHNFSFSLQSRNYIFYSIVVAR